MDAGLRLSEEPRSGDGHRDGDLHQIEFRPYRDEDLKAFCPILWEYWGKVYGEDLLEPIDVITSEGKVRLLKAEAKVYQLQAERCGIQLVWKDGAIIGFMLYHLAYDCILLIKGMYIEPAHEGKGLGKGRLIASLGKPIKRLFFQSYASNPPERMLKITPEKRELHHDGDLITWEMDWET